MDLETSVLNGRQFRADIWELLQLVEVRDKRGHAVLRFLSVALQHQDSIVILISTRSNDSSALALLRPMYETCLRGVWVGACAEEPQIQMILEGEFNFQAANPGKAIDDKFGASVSKETRVMIFQAASLTPASNRLRRNTLVSIRLNLSSSSRRCCTPSGLQALS